MKGYLGVLFTLYLVYCVATQQCSKYHYEEQILSKVTRMEHRLEMLEEKVSKEVKVCSHCPDGWIKYKGSCYLFVENKLSFDAAQANCQCLHGHLVHIENENENAFLRNHLRTLKDSLMWIGLTDSETEGVFKWIDDSSTVSFTDWSPKQPDNSGNKEDCVEFYPDLKWNDRNCEASLRSICENKLKLTLQS
ncbi:perlucin-like isoform X2 [Ruditapes philippinarum]|uniref:perlucin-like isoform X2 n=1 Tax=Ruditapes philippinarum TaxID=129788 RepID=UPI00295B3A64|nr:perlucin-like isoform X2 [Ruditapes philippinarum]